MESTDLLLMAVGGIISGILAGILGIGGGVLMVPLLVAFDNEAVQATATSSLAILIIATSGTLQNLRTNQLSLAKVFYLGLPASLMAIAGAFVADKIPSSILLLTFGIMLVVNVFLVDRRKSLPATPLPQTLHGSADTSVDGSRPAAHLLSSPIWARIATGSSAGFLAGLLGVGGGVIMVPMQVLLLNEPLKTAIRTSLGVIVIVAFSSCIEQARNGNILFMQGIALGAGGFIGAQLGSRFLPRISDRVVSILFRSLMGILAIYTFWKAWASLTQA